MNLPDTLLSPKLHASSSDIMGKADPMERIADKAGRYLADHMLEYHELQDLFCSTEITNLIADKDSKVTGGKVYDQVMDTFHAKYKVIFDVMDSSDSKVKGTKNIDYLSLLITLMNDKTLTPQELYLLENATKHITSNKKYNILTAVIQYLDEMEKLMKKGKTDDKALNELRKKYKFTKAQAAQVEAIISEDDEE